ncbi:hypothetical protein MMC20_001068 [Loxospora ochrophaea]|nr:hypothetical protein [Loxospora ochrophaea]
MSKETSLEELAAQISESAKAISTYCAENKHPQRSFERDSPSTLLPSKDVPQDLQSAQQSLLEAAARIQFLATDANNALYRHIVQYQQLNSLQWLWHFRIPAYVPLEGTISYSELAAAAHVPEVQLKSIARMGMTEHFFCEPSPGQVAHSAFSALFVTEPNLLDWALFLSNMSAPTAARMTEATDKWGATEAKNETACNIALATDKPFFDYVATSPAMSKQFAGYMKNISTMAGLRVTHLLSGFDWSSLGEATVVDVGGSTGHASIALATAFPNITFIVEDLPSTLSSTTNTSTSPLSSLPASTATRITYQPHDFFTPQPILNADIYLLRIVIHDWPNDKATQILSHLAQTLKESTNPRGARILIMDSVLPPPGSVPSTQESMLRVRDLTMMQSFNSGERELSDWEELLGRTEPRLKMKSLVTPFGSFLSVMEVVCAE